MTSLVSRFKAIEKLAIDNSPVLLTAIGVAGVIGTAILTHRAALKTHRVLLEVEDNQLANKEPFTPLTPKEKVKATWTHYIPPVVSGTATITAIVLANHISTKRAAALAVACTISEKAYTEYRDKVVERFGEKEENQIRNGIAQDRIDKAPPTEGNVLMVSGGDHLFMEMYTGRYFRSDIETIRRAENQLNHKLNTNGYATVSDFYDMIGLAHTAISDEIGWNSDKLMAVDYQAILSEDGQPCVAINFVTGPVRDYTRFHG